MATIERVNERLRDLRDATSRFSIITRGVVDAGRRARVQLTDPDADPDLDDVIAEVVNMGRAMERLGTFGGWTDYTTAVRDYAQTLTEFLQAQGFDVKDAWVEMFTDASGEFLQGVDDEIAGEGGV